MVPRQHCAKELADVNLVNHGTFQSICKDGVVKMLGRVVGIPCVSDEGCSLVNLVHAHRSQGAHVLSFVLVRITAHDNPLICVDKSADIVPVLMALRFKFFVPIQQDEEHTVLTYFYDGFHHARHGLMLLCA